MVLSIKPYIAILALISVGGCKAQSVEDEINADVWFPFMASYENLDAAAFMELHTDDVLRINRDGANIRSHDTYARDIADSFARSRAQGTKRRIEFSFLQRMHSADVTYEIGFYRVVSASGGQQRTTYGKFHVLLRKVDAAWKIAIDADATQDPVIYEEDFMSGTILEK